MVSIAPTARPPAIVHPPLPSAPSPKMRAPFATTEMLSAYKAARRIPRVGGVPEAQLRGAPGNGVQRDVDVDPRTVAAAIDGWGVVAVM